jgi:hypothetical protein
VSDVAVRALQRLRQLLTTHPLGAIHDLPRRRWHLQRSARWSKFNTKAGFVAKQ